MDHFVEQLIEILQLEPLPFEGGLFKRTYCSNDQIPADALDQRYAVRENKPLATAIYYLLTDHPDSFSALHRLASDEIYHFYLGDPIEMLLLFPDGSHQALVLGQDLLSGQQVQYCVPHGAWQGSRLRPGGRFALLGASMAPGFTEDVFELGQREWLTERYPHLETHIRRLTRS